jgi:hypothetical protein
VRAGGRVRRRPASADPQPGEPGAATSGDDPAPDGVSEFFADELALTLNCALAAATTLTGHALTLTGSLPATLTELAAGRLPRAHRHGGRHADHRRPRA